MQVYELLSNNYVEDDDNMFRYTYTHIHTQTHTDKHTHKDQHTHTHTDTQMNTNAPTRAALYAHHTDDASLAAHTTM